MKLILGLAFASLLVFPSNVLAANWVLAGKAVEDSFFVDVNSMIKRGNEVGFWELMKRAVPDEYGVSSDMVYEIEDCQNRLGEQKQITAYDSNNRPITTFNTDTVSLIIPDTIGEKIFNIVCFTKQTDLTSPSKSRLDIEQLLVQLKHAELRLNWEKAVNIVDEMIAITPLSNYKQIAALITYRAKMKALDDSQLRPIGKDSGS